MVYDCFCFFNELDILEMRLNILDSVVDKFVITESTLTFTGKEKKLYYKENENRFLKFKDKIIYNLVTDLPKEAENAWMREYFQVNAVKRGIEHCEDEDVILYGDVDEIPNPKCILEILENYDKKIIYHFAQRMFYCYLNYERIGGDALLSSTGEFDGITKKDERWLGTKMCTYQILKDKEIHAYLRAPITKEIGKRIENGGWHFGYVGGDGDEDVLERVKKKLEAFSHQEFNNEKTYDNIERNLKKGRDIFSRNSDFIQTKIDDTYPDYLRKNYFQYQNIILPPNSKVEKVTLLIRRLIRNVKRKV